MWVIDFEASGLSRKSYPIKVGVTNGDTKYSALIKPMPHWDYWDSAAQSVHNISRKELSSIGQPSSVVAVELNNILENNIVYCDCIEWDGFWGNVLFSDNALTMKFEMRDIRELLTEDPQIQAC